MIQRTSTAYAGRVVGSETDNLETDGGTTMNLESVIQPRDCSLTTFNVKRSSSSRLTMIASLLLTIPV